VHTYTKPQTSSTRSRCLGWRIHGSVEDTKLSTNKQHSLSQAGKRPRRGSARRIRADGTISGPAAGHRDQAHPPAPAAPARRVPLFRRSPCSCLIEPHTQRPVYVALYVSHSHPLETSVQLSGLPRVFVHALAYSCSCTRTLANSCSCTRSVLFPPLSSCAAMSDSRCSAPQRGSTAPGRHGHQTTPR